jgi:tetratricopeptide (TPR) repeat protein
MVKAQQQSPQLTFDRANQQLQEGNIQQALALYQSLEQQNKYSGALFLNMGLSYLRIDSTGKAKFYLLKAEQFDETESKAEQALDYVETRFSHQSAVLPELPWQKALNWLGSEVGSPTILGIGLLLFNLGIVTFISTWFYNVSSTVWPRSAITTACLGALIILLSFYTNYRQQRYSKAVMITQQTNVLDQPKAEATVVNQAFEGYTFTVDHNKSSNEDRWSYIRMSNGLYGWIPTEEIMIL